MTRSVTKAKSPRVPRRPPGKKERVPRDMRAQTIANDVARAERIETMAIRIGDEAASLRVSAERQLQQLRRERKA
jgi:hypothetical protein